MQQILSKNRWIVLISAILCQCICNFPSAWGVFQPYIATEYGYTQDASTLVMPLCVVAFGIVSIIGGRVQDTVSTKMAALIGSTMMAISFINAYWIPAGNPLYMYIGFSFFFGGGCGFLFSTMFSCSMKWYADKKGFANGLIGCMAGVYIIGLMYAAEYLLANFGARKTFLIVGAVSAVIAYGTSFVFVNPTQAYVQEKTAMADQGKPKNSKTQIEVVDFQTNEMLRTKQYYLLIASIMLVMPAYMLINPAFITICIEKGLTKEVALSALAISSASTAVGRLIVPWLSDFFGRKRVLVVMWALVAACAFLFMTATGNMIIVIYALLAFFYSGGFSAIGPMATELFGYTYAGTNVGFVNISNSIGSLIGAPLMAMLTPLFGANTRSMVGVIGAMLSMVCMALLNTNMRATKEKLRKANAEDA